MGEIQLPTTHSINAECLITEKIILHQTKIQTELPVYRNSVLKHQLQGLIVTKSNICI